MKLERILEAIPTDDWVTASDVEAKTGISAHSVGAFISQRLNTYVERRFTRFQTGGCYEYRRRISIRMYVP